MTALGVRDRYTVDDLQRLDTQDGSRYEVLHGTLLVTPPPSYAHNRRQQRLGRTLTAAAEPLGLEVLSTGTQAVQIGTDGPCPDLLVFEPGAYDYAVPVARVHLLVEVTSPSNRANDTVTKLHAYAAAGAPHYWVVDPHEIAVYALDHGVYRLVTRGATVSVTEPFPVSVTLD